MVNTNPINNEFIVDLKGFDGPLEFLLSLAQKQKVDLKEISIAELVDQYLFFLKTASKLKLELAAEYLMMASFLTYLKSRILLPKDLFEEELSSSELEQNPAFKLKRLSEIKRQKRLIALYKPLNIFLFFLIFQVILGILTLISGLNIYLASFHQITGVLLVLSALNLYYLRTK